MNKIALLILSTLILCMSTCGTGSASLCGPVEKNIVGTWTTTAKETYVFNSDGTLTCTEYNQKPYSARYKFNGSGVLDMQVPFFGWKTYVLDWKSENEFVTDYTFGKVTFQRAATPRPKSNFDITIKSVHPKDAETVVVEFVTSGTPDDPNFRMDIWQSPEEMLMTKQMTKYDFLKSFNVSTSNLSAGQPYVASLEISLRPNKKKPYFIVAYALNNKISQAFFRLAQTDDLSYPDGSAVVDPNTRKPYPCPATLDVAKNYSEAQKIIQSGDYTVAMGYGYMVGYLLKEMRRTISAQPGSRENSRKNTQM